MISNNEFDDWGQNQSSDDSAESAPSVDLMQVAMRRKGLIALGVFVGICLGILYYARATPIYESTAMMSITDNTPPSMMNNLDTFVKQTAAEDHAIKISSPVIINNALKM